jgi:hypothetical protein
MKKAMYTFIGIGIFFSSVMPIYAAKVRVRKHVTIAGVSYSAAKLSRPTHSITVTFTNLGQVEKSEYVLSYLTNGIDQGVVGTVNATGQPTDSRDLYFGTCSHGVCTPHYNITNATLVITTSLKNGGVNTKRYRIKI